MSHPDWQCTNPNTHHPITSVYLKAVNAAIQRYRTGETVVSELRKELFALRHNYNMGVLIT